MSTPLRQLLHAVLFDQNSRTQLAADPEGFLADHGWGELAGPELEEAIAALGDTMPVETAQAIEYGCDTIDFSGESLAEIGADLSTLVDQIDLELPTSLVLPEPTGADIDLDDDFGTGAELPTEVDSELDATDAIEAVLDSDGALELPEDSVWSTPDSDLDLDEPAELDAAESFLPDVDDAGDLDVDTNGPDDSGLDFEA